MKRRNLPPLANTVSGRRKGLPPPRASFQQLQARTRWGPTRSLALGCRPGFPHLVLAGVVRVSSALIAPGKALFSSTQRDAVAESPHRRRRWGVAERVGKTRSAAPPSGGRLKPLLIFNRRYHGRCYTPLTITREHTHPFRCHSPRNRRPSVRRRGEIPPATYGFFSVFSVLIR